MITIFQTAFELQDFCDRRGWRSCFIGGIAVQRWGQARVTRYVDIPLLTGFGQEDVFIEPLLAHYAPRNGGAADFARRARVLLLRSPSGIGIDISLGALPFERLVVERATPFEFAPGLDLRICSAEDLMVMKLFAARAIDIRDAEGIAVRHDKTLDWAYYRGAVDAAGRSQGGAGDPGSTGSHPPPQRHSVSGEKRKRPPPTVRVCEPSAWAAWKSFPWRLRYRPLP